MAQALASEKPSPKRQSISRRSAFEVRLDVLSVVSEGCAKPTQIMYRSNTSWTVLQEILSWLTASGFLRQSEERSRTEYAVTDKGYAIVRDYVRLLDATVAKSE
jgi:predicted transcriptional regulator